MAQVKERVLENAIMEWLQWQSNVGLQVLPIGIKCGQFQTQSGGWHKATSINGVSDIIVCYKGQFIGLELKVGKNKQLPTQIEFQKKLENAGGKYFVIRSLDDLKAVFNDGK